MEKGQLRSNQVFRWLTRRAVSAVFVTLFTVLLSGANAQSAAKIDLQCPCSYDIQGDSLTLSVASVTFNGTGRTGTLKLKLWATTTHFAEAVRGHVLAEWKLGELSTNQYFDSPSMTVPYTPPPAGTYYITITLSEFYNGRDVIRAYATFNPTVTFDSDPGPVPDTGSGTSHTYGADESLPGFPTPFQMFKLVEKIHNADLSGSRGAYLFIHGGFIELHDGTIFTCITSGRRCRVGPSGKVIEGTFRVTTPGVRGRGSKMYWADQEAGKIQRSDIDGTYRALEVEDLVTGLYAPTSLALDVAGGKMYWTDQGKFKIQRANLDGSEVEDLVTTGSEGLTGLALDVAGGKMYWADRETNKIQRANLDGSGVEDLVIGLRAPTSLALDVADGRMYWADRETNKIQRANLDGSGVEDLVTLLSPEHLALDVADGRMYWTNAFRDSIQRANLDGSGVEDLLTLNTDWTSHHLTGLALDVAVGKMYWIDKYRIQRSDLDGSDVEDLIDGLATGAGWDIYLESPTGLTLDLVTDSLDGRDGSGSGSPDLVIRSPAMSDSRLDAGASFTLSVKVYNQGNGSSAVTTLRYYRSSNSTITESDTHVGADSVSGLSALSTIVKQISLSAPSSPGTYYYGACVVSVSDESKNNNNCSAGVRVTVW